MKFVKALGATCAAVVLGVMLLGGSSASATALCKSNTNPCPQAEIYPTNSTLKAELVGKTVMFSTNVENIACEESKLVGNWQTDATGEYSKGEVSVLEFTPGKCEALTKKAKCTTMNVLHRPYGAKASASGGGNGQITLSNGGTGEPAFEIVCGNINCTLTAHELPFNITGGGPAKAEISAGGSQFAGVKCPSGLFTVVGEYEVTQPTAAEKLFIESSVAPPVLCKANQIPCVGGNILGVPTTLKAEYAAAAKFKFTYFGENREPTCNISKFEGATTTAGKPLLGEVSLLSFETCGGGSCNVTAQGTPYKFEIDRAGGGNGTMAWSKLSGTEPTFKIKCGLTEECVYKASSIAWTITGSLTAPTFASSGSVPLTGSTVGCSSTASWEGVGGVAEVKYKFTTPLALFVTS